MFLSNIQRTNLNSNIHAHQRMHAFGMSGLLPNYGHASIPFMSLLPDLRKKSRGPTRTKSRRKSSRGKSRKPKSPKFQGNVTA